MTRRSVIQILPTLKLTGGTAAKVKMLAEHSAYRQVICVTNHPANSAYTDQWKEISNCVVEQVYTFRNPILNAFRLHKLIRKYNAKVIHAYFPIDSVSCGLLKIFCPSVKIVRSFEGSLAYSKCRRWIQAWSFKNHDYFIAISKYVCSFYQNIFPSIEKRMTIVYNCPAFFEELDKPVIHKVSTKRVVNVGCCNPTKNTETIIRAAKILKSRGIEVKFDVVGDGCLRPVAENLIKELDVAEYVCLRGFSDNVKSYLDACSFYIHPANLEGFGMSVVEAMGRCCAVIVSDSCALPELVDDGVDGLIAKTYAPEDWADKIEYLLANQTIVDEFGRKAYEKVRTIFSVKEFVKNHDEIYRKLYENNCKNINRGYGSNYWI